MLYNILHTTACRKLSLHPANPSWWFILDIGLWWKYHRWFQSCGCMHWTYEYECHMFWGFEGALMGTFRYSGAESHHSNFGRPNAKYLIFKIFFITVYMQSLLLSICSHYYCIYAVTITVYMQSLLLSMCSNYYCLYAVTLPHICSNSHFLYWVTIHKIINSIWLQKSQLIVISK